MLINTMVLLEDDDMYVRHLRLFSLNETSSYSLRKKTFSDNHSDMEEFFFHMRLIDETERVFTPPGEVMMRSWFSSKASQSSRNPY